MGEVVSMKGYARKNKRMQLNVKYRWRGMAKSNTRKQNKRLSFQDASAGEYEGTTFNPRKVPAVCKLY